ncbi:hypothetical protein KKD57_05465 [Patescibacteria group bacterium]|nr:hypothetical protein [Patescibacteria group bacterium]MBU4338972.1 hypothetical protein [Patescibacteria group bacterium]
MGKNKIMDDLKEFLNTRSEFTQKSEVAYFLSEVRKVIEKENIKDKIKA